MDGESRIARSRRLTRTAWGVIRSDGTVLTLAITSAIIALCVAAAMFWISGWVQHPGRGSLLLGAAITYWPAMLVGTFFGVALAAAAAAALDGGHLMLRQALAVPASRLGQIVLWSLLAAGIGLLIQQVISRLPFGGRLAAFVAGTAWSLATLFVIPILALEGCTATECVRRSAGLLKRRWGEGISGTVILTGWLVVVMVPLGILLGVAGAASGSQLVTYALLLGSIVLVSSFNGSAMQVFAVALYRYANDGSAPGPFGERDLERPFTPKRRGLFRR